MNTLLSTAAGNALIVAGLFVVLMLLRRWIRNPAVFHLLCLLVLLKLLTPPMWRMELAWLPAREARSGTATRSMGTPVQADSATRGRGPAIGHDGRGIAASDGARVTVPSDLRLTQSSDAGRTVAHSQPARLSLSAWFTTVWLGGSIVVLVVAMTRVFRFQHYLRGHNETPAEANRLTAALAEHLGLRKTPYVQFVPVDVSPMLSALAGGARIIMPTGLWQQVDQRGREALLLHELAHYDRRDHWVRVVEFLATVLYWWNPILWWLRHEMRVAEEQCCDAIVVAAFPEQRRSYAEAIVKTLGCVSTTPVVPGAIGVGLNRNVEQRLSRIMLDEPTARLNGWAKLSAAVIAIGLLPLAPTFAQADRGGDKPFGQEAADGHTLVSQDTITVCVVTTNDQPAVGVEVAAFVNGKAWETLFTSDGQGQVFVPADWLQEDSPDKTRAVLWIRDDQSHLGWLDFDRLESGDRQKRRARRIVLLPRDRTVRGKLVDNHGRALPGVSIGVERLYHKRNGYVRQYSVTDSEWFAPAKSDASGNFTIVLPAADCELRPLHPSWIGKRIPRNADTDDLGAITLAPAGRIEGRVVHGNTGRPLVGHRIGAQAMDWDSLSDRSAGWADTRTDEDGRYVLGGLPAGMFNVLHLGLIEDPQWTGPAHEGVAVVVGEAVQANFEVARGKRLVGKVIDGTTGKPLPRIPVGYYGSARPDSGAACMMTRTKDDGSFEFFVPPGVSKVYVADGKFRSVPDSSRTLHVREDADSRPLVLKAGPPASGLVAESVSEEPATIAGTEQMAPRRKADAYQACLQLLPPAGMSVTKVEVRTVFKGARHPSMWSSAAGEKVKVPMGTFTDGRAAFFLIEAKGFQPARSAELVVQETMPPLTVRLKAAAFAPIRGRVVDGAGRPVADATVRVRRRIYGRDIKFPWGLEYQTGTDGRFEIEHVRVGDRIRIHIDKDGTGGALSEWLEPDTKEVISLPDFVLGPPESKLGGRVRDYEGFAVVGAKVSLLNDRAVTTKSDADGKFLLSNVPVGEIQLSIESSGFPPDTCVAYAGKTDNEVRVNRISADDRKNHTVRIHLRTADGQSVTNATLYWCEHEGRHLMTMPGRKGNEHAVEFARNARRSAGKAFVVLVTADGYAFAHSDPIPNRQNPPPVTIELQPAQPVTLRGSVVNGDGEPIADAEVGLSLRLTAADNSERWRFFNSRAELPRTDADGRFAIPGLHVGSQLAVYVSKLGYAGVWSKRVKLEESREYHLSDLTLRVGTAKISGSVLDERGEPIADALVTLLDLGPVIATTDSHGRFRFDSIGDRKYPMRVVSEEGRWHGEVVANTTDLTVTLRGDR